MAAISGYKAKPGYFIFAHSCAQVCPYLNKLNKWQYCFAKVINQGDFPTWDLLFLKEIRCSVALVNHFSDDIKNVSKKN